MVPESDEPSLLLSQRCPRLPVLGSAVRGQRLGELNGKVEELRQFPHEAAPQSLLHKPASEDVHVEPPQKSCRNSGSRQQTTPLRPSPRYSHDRQDGRHVDNQHDQELHHQILERHRSFYLPQAVWKAVDGSIPDRDVVEEEPGLADKHRERANQRAQSVPIVLGPSRLHATVGPKGSASFGRATSLLQRTH